MILNFKQVYICDYFFGHTYLTLLFNYDMTTNLKKKGPVIKYT